MQKATPQEIANATQKQTKKADPSPIEEMFLAALLQELNVSKNSKSIFDAFYREIKKPLHFTPLRAKVLWWAFSQIFNKEDFKAVDCKNVIAFFSAPDVQLMSDTFAGLVDKETGRHTALALKPNSAKLTHEVMIDYVNELCAKEAAFSASEYFAMWRSAYADKIRDSKIEQIKVRFDKSNNYDNFFREMAEVEKEYRATVQPSVTQESKSLSSLDIEKVAEIIGGTTSKTHFIPTAETELNRQVFGFPRGGLSLVTGVTGGGKSLHLLRYAYHAYQQGYKVLFLSLELSEQRILRELMTIGGQIPNSRIEQATTKEEMHELTTHFLDKAKRDGGKKGLFLYDVCIDMELGSLLNVAKVHAAAFQLDMICIDLFDEIPIPQEYAMNPNGKGGYFESMLNAWLGVGRDYNCAVTGAVQLKAEAVLNGKIQQEAIGGSIWYAKKSSLILYSHRSSNDYKGLSYYGIEVLKDRESGFGRKGYQVIRSIDRDTKITDTAPFRSMQQLEKKIEYEQKEMEREF